MKAAEAHIYVTELDAEFSISSSHRRKNTLVRRYLCCCAGSYVAKTSTKKGEDCTAGFTLRLVTDSNGNETVTLIDE